MDEEKKQEFVEVEEGRFISRLVDQVIERCEKEFGEILAVTVWVSRKKEKEDI